MAKQTNKKQTVKKGDKVAKFTQDEILKRLEKPSKKLIRFLKENNWKGASASERLLSKSASIPSVASAPIKVMIV